MTPPELTARQRHAQPEPPAHRAAAPPGDSGRPRAAENIVGPLSEGMGWMGWGGVQGTRGYAEVAGGRVPLRDPSPGIWIPGNLCVHRPRSETRGCWGAGAQGWRPPLRAGSAWGPAGAAAWASRERQRAVLLPASEHEEEEEEEGWRSHGSRPRQRCPVPRCAVPAGPGAGSVPAASADVAARSRGAQRG